MKITKTKLKQIIKEEVVKLLVEQDEYDYDDYDYEEEELTPAQKIIRFLSSKDPDTFAQGVEIYSLVKDDIEANAQTENSQILEKLRVIDQFAGSDIPDVGSLSVLSDLNVTEEIDLSGCESLKNVDGFQNVDEPQRLTNLTELDLSWCTSLQNIDGLEGCTNLASLYLNRCESLQNVGGLQGLTNLKSLDLSGCTSLQNVDALKGCTNLTSLFLNGCESLPRALQRSFHSFEHIGTAYEQFMKALNASKGNQP